MSDASSHDMQPGNGYRLPPEAYFDDRWLELEREKLFPDTWIFACTVDELDRAGSYRSLRVGHYPIVVLRDQEDRIRAFHNVCRHRGARLLADEGHCTRIICPYHSWMYALDGRLLSAPQASTELPNMELGEWGLQPVSVGVWMGMVFVNASGKAPPFDAWIAPVRDQLDVYRADELTTIGQAEISFEANWKFYVENHIDWYHLWYTHAKSLTAFDHPAGVRRQSGRHWVSFEPFKESVEAAYPLRPIDHITGDATGIGAHLLFPTLTLFGDKSWFGIGALTPETPDRTRMRFLIRALAGQDPGKLLALFKGITKDEDGVMIARLQEAVRSPAYRVGPLTATYEEPITRFHDHYLEAMGLSA